jgi:hypothetical protein
VTIAELRERGVFEVGRVIGSALCYARTRSGLVLVHVDRIGDRQLDRYGLDFAARKIELGFSIDETAWGLGINEQTLRNQLAADGWVQGSRRVDGPRRGSGSRFDAARARGKRVPLGRKGSPSC